MAVHGNAEIAVIGLQMLDRDLLAVREPGPRHTRQKMQGTFFQLLQCQHPPAAHQEPALLMELVRARQEIMLPKAVGPPVRKACKAAVEFLKEQLHITVQKLSIGMGAVIRLGKADVIQGQKFGKIGKDLVRGRFIRVNDAL